MTPRIFYSPYNTWRVGTFVTNSERTARKKARDTGDTLYVYVGRDEWKAA